MEDAVWFRPRPISVIVTTYGSDTYYTQACLESIARWKCPHHELIVVTHDETPLLGALVQAYRAEGLIDRLIYAENGHGHTRSFNLALGYATGDVVFNICNDILIGPQLIDVCAGLLRREPQLGIIGWHWYSEGTRWENGQVVQHAVRDPEQPRLSPDDEHNIRSAKWFTGKFFESVGEPLWLQLCNTSFFGVRRELLLHVGGFGPQYPHYWADDFLNYAVLDQGLDIRHFPAEYRRREFFHEFQYDNTEVNDRHRHDDRIVPAGAYLDILETMHGGMSRDESVYLHTLARGIPNGATVIHLGTWRGSSAIVFLDALKNRRIRFLFIDCFDQPEIASLSAQPPVTREEFLANIAGYVGAEHAVEVIKANTLDLDRLPRADFVFVDAGHTKECIAHDAPMVRDCLTPDGTAAFHDYGQPSWPDVKPVLDEIFSDLEVFGTVAVHRKSRPAREGFTWPQVAMQEI